MSEHSTGPRSSAALRDRDATTGVAMRLLQPDHKALKQRSPRTDQAPQMPADHRSRTALVAPEWQPLKNETTTVLADRRLSQRVLVVDEHPLLGAGLRAVLASEPWVASCLVATSAMTAWQVALRRHPQLVLVSASLGGRSGFDLCRAFKERMPHVKVVLMSPEAPVSAALAAKHGAVASLPKKMPPAAIVAAVKRVAEGARVFPKDSTPATTRLSKRELDVLQHVASGLSNPEVAVRLNLSRWTVKQHTSAVYRKLGVRNRAEAASRAQQLGLIA